MHIEDPRWEEYEARFRGLMAQVTLHRGPLPELASAEQHLCLYGDNALSPEEEFAMLSRFEAQPEQVRGVEMLTSYWEDVVLYIP